MARPPKNKQVAAVAPAQEVAIAAASTSATMAPQRPIDVEGFIRVRDSVYSRLKSIHNLIGTFTQDYLRQTNLLIGLGEGMEDVGDLSALNGMGMDLANVGLPIMPNVLAAPVPRPGEEVKKERKKRQHDPNAPKRPLTPYFLYMQTARPIIADDLGADAAKGAVQEEGQRRWSTMSAREKAGWDQAYQFNLRLYNARVHSYKNGNQGAKEMSDDDALAYADINNIPMPTGKDAAVADISNDQEAIAQQLQGQVAEPVAQEPEEEEEQQQQPEEEEEQPSSPPAAKTPKSTKKGAVGKRKSAAASEVATPAPEPKKRKRQSKAAEETPAPEPAKKSSRAKKNKSA
ncbi:hypothetical protein MCOR27_011423 [Pyricularia oryzae]|uniref:HMG box domain-containing protein n=5 Tax=Pyricularia TaxID=48558 RepID=A0ABQ8NKQ5_PYRGI|nr:high mobility group protein [Pyricularia oryzae 70-15]ELQ36487.1 high mobility group protein [Pyricularia oryzae Y34]KAH8836848.1 hypothetical protein MCOR01_010508 [Pyricularia oryzae]KAI6297715.1 hypothetical protein MCOR33_006042 [Pyricularia grisea]EHA54442.1 high mobility group protein [Pyricularia oryzae 70-15]KAH9438503.1 hypothetical protein MCOR02_002122 [Pyricularia oryzae]